MVTLDGAHPVFYVRDNGIGIREKHLDNVFKIFKRLHPAGHYGGGTGAGLTIVQKIVEWHGGRVWADSTYGENSTFYFTLGSAAASGKQSATKQSATKQSATKQNSANHVSSGHSRDRRDAD